MSDYDMLLLRTEHQDAEIMWLRSPLISLLTLAEAENSPLTPKQVAAICKVALEKREGN